MARRALIGGVLAALILAALVLHARQPGPRRAPATPGAASKTYAELAAANFRTLTATQSRRLLRFAVAFRSCMDARGIQLTVPQTSPTRIVLHVEGRPIPSTMRTAVVSCGERLGGPPPGSSLQSPRGRPGVILLYLPKQCLLDPAVTSG